MFQFCVTVGRIVVLVSAHEKSDVNVPRDNRVAYHFALAAGMNVYGQNECSFLKNGKLHDQICLGISRPADMPLFGAAQVELSTTT